MNKDEAYTKTRELILSDENVHSGIEFYRGYLLALFNFNLINVEEKTNLNNILNKRGR